MGTSATIAFVDEGRFLGSIYSHRDGYPTGVGKQIKGLFPAKAQIVNGIGGAMDNPEYFNGMDCLGAYVIKHLKGGIGGVYLSGVNPLDYADTNYSYVLSPADSNLIRLRIMGGDGEMIYDGLLDDADMDQIEEDM